MHKLSPITALGNQSGHSVEIGPITLSEIADFSIVSVAARLGHESNCDDILTDLQSNSHAENGRINPTEELTVFGIGQDQWLVTDPVDIQEDLTIRLKGMFKQTASITEQSGAWACFDLSGPNLHFVLERLCPINFAKLNPGAAVRTQIDHIGCFVTYYERPIDFLRFLGPTSFARSLHEAISVAARSVESQNHASEALGPDFIS